MKMVFKDVLKIELTKPLPGEEAQNLMSPSYAHAYRVPKPNYKEACVVLLIHIKENLPYITLIKRAYSHPEDKHGGQISFPGGKVDEDDCSFEYCALRELYEELGLDPNKIEILGRLSSLYVYVSHFLVYPFVGFIHGVPNYIPEESEVAQVFDVPLHHFLDTKNIKLKTLHSNGHEIKDMPYYDINGDILWGATAMILSEFIELIKKGSLI